MTATTHVPVASLCEVSVRYGAVEVLAVVALDVAEAETLAVIGPNGSGKSTLLRVLGLLQVPSAGEVLFRGRAVRADQALAVRRRQAMVFQQPLLADTSVMASAFLGLCFRGVRGAVARARARRWLERLGVAHLHARRAHSLSGGEAQRVALARALALEPELLLLDEPFAALDPPSRAALISDLHAILREERVATVLVTHDRDEAQALADRVAVVLRGSLQQVDRIARVFNAPASEEVARFVGVETIAPGLVVSGDGEVALIEVAGRRLKVVGDVKPGERVRVCLRPEDVAVGRFDVAWTPGRDCNRLAGAVTRVNRAGAAVHVVMDCGFPLVAAVTPRSAEELGLVPGERIVAVFPASAPHLLI
jgi:tungstate transport system ATP-binding protein